MGGFVGEYRSVGLPVGGGLYGIVGRGVGATYVMVGCGVGCGGTYATVGCGVGGGT